MTKMIGYGMSSRRAISPSPNTKVRNRTKISANCMPEKVKGNGQKAKSGALDSQRATGNTGEPHFL